MNLKNKNIVLAGVGSGIGRACALLFAKQGANLILISRHAEKLEAIQQETKIYGIKTLVIAADLTQKNVVVQTFQKIKEDFSNIDVLMCNCGTFTMAPIETLSENDWDSTLNINLKSYFLTVQAALPLLSNPASIILTAAVFGQNVTLKKLAHYNASKAGIVAFAKTLALELAEKNVRVNTICPGQISHQVLDDKNLIPQPKILRGGLPEDIAQAALYFASDASFWVTGSVLNVDGGMSLGISVKA